MEMTGDLSDFALTDILQILALSKKTGTLLIENEYLEGRVLIESGRIIGAWSNQGRGLREHLLDQGVRSGLLTDKQVQDLYKRHLQSVVGRLVSIEKGRFGISLNEVSMTDLPVFLIGGEGLDVEEILLEYAREQDESRLSKQNNTGRESDNEVRFVDFPNNAEEVKESSLWILSMLSELRSSLCETDISLMVLRCASELTSRGILFGLKGNQVCGIGQYGIGGETSCQVGADSLVKSINIPTSGDSLLAMVSRTGQAYYGPKGSGFWDTYFQKLVGTDQDNLDVCILPVNSLDKPQFILYTDNHPHTQQLRYLEILSVFVDQAGLMLDKLTLIQQLKRMEDNGLPDQ